MYSLEGVWSLGRKIRVLLPDQGERVSGGKTTGVTPLLERERREWEERGTEREAEWEGEQRKKKRVREK